MKIAFITFGFTPLRTSGLDISGERLIVGLLDQGHDLTVIAAQNEVLPETIQHPNLTIHRIPLGPTNWIGFGYQAAQTLKKLQKANHFDVIHFWDIYFAWAYRGNFIGSIQHSFRQRIKNSPNVNFIKKIYYLLAMLLAERPAIKKTSLVMGGSQTSLEQYIQQYKIPAPKTQLARHGIDTHFFQYQPVEYLRDKLQLNPDTPVLMFSGFITPRKGLSYLASAYQRLSPAPYLVITGKWSDANKNEIMNQLDLEHQEKIIYVGFVPDQEMPSYYSLADIYVSASLLEGFGLPLAEALSCGTAVVTTDSGSAKEVAGPGALYAHPADPDGLFSAIKQLIDHPELRKKMGQAGREHIHTYFSVEKMIADTISSYQFYLDKKN